MQEISAIELHLFLQWTLAFLCKWNVSHEFISVIIFSSAIAEPEKEAIRAKLLQSFGEPVQPVALQIAVLIGKAAR